MHNVRNAMLALAAARTCGLSYEDATRGIARVVPPPMRAAWHNIGRATVINDAYNANPASMCAALDLLANVRGTQRVAVLGTMRELGLEAARYHDDVARAALASTADLVAGMGEMADALRRVAGKDERVVTAPDVDELWVALAPRLAADATILLKASRGVRLERLVPHITTWAAA
jgi:UDP-N-acetylmuramoyl-tripeptide--D-alanyl-D-alanine ligase